MTDAKTQPDHLHPSHCVRCRYDLAGVTDPARVCPECGADNSATAIDARNSHFRKMESRWLRIAGGGLISACVLAIALVFVSDIAKYYPRLHDTTQGKWIHSTSVWTRSLLMAGVCVAIGLLGCSVARYVYVVRTWEFRTLNVACGCAYGFAAMLVAVAVCGIAGNIVRGLVPWLMGIAP